MGDKPSVTLTLAGDESRLTKAFDSVGAASKDMSDTVADSSKHMVDSGKRFEELAEKSDTVDTRAMGFRDTITGVSDTLKGFNDTSLSTEERLLTLGMGVGDFASGLTNLVIPAIGNLAAMMRGPLASAMTFISSHPLLITLGLLAAAVIFLISQTDWFQAVATRVFTWVGHLARDVFGSAVDFVIFVWHRVTSFFESLPERLGSALGSIGGFFERAFKAGINIAIDILNWGIRRINDLIYGINVINPFDDIPPIPEIKKLHTGGVFHAPSGSGEGLALLRDGERVTPAGQGSAGGGGPYQISVPLVEQIQAWFNDGTLVLVGR